MDYYWSVRLSRAGLLAAAVMLVVGWQSGCALSIPVKIVSSLPMRGPLVRQTESMVQAIQMAVDECGGQAGRCRVSYEAWDDGNAQNGDWSGEEANARRAVADDSVMVVIGPYNSGAARLSIPILNRAGLVMISPACTYPGLTRSGPGVQPGEPGCYYPTGSRNFCRLVPTDLVQGAAGAVWAAALGMRRVYVLHSMDGFGTALGAIFAHACHHRGLTVVGQEGLPDLTHLDACVQRMADSRADLVYFSGTTANGAATVLLALRQAGVHARFMGPGGIRDSGFLDAAGPEAEGVCATLGALPLEELPAAAKEWYDRYVTRYGSTPDAYTIYAYEAARVALNALAQVSAADRGAVRSAVMSTQNYHGVLGTWSLDADGDTTMHAMSAYRVERHQFRFVQLVTP